MVVENGVFIVENCADITGNIFYIEGKILCYVYLFDKDVTKYYIGRTRSCIVRVNVARVPIFITCGQQAFSKSHNTNLKPRQTTKYTQ